MPDVPTGRGEVKDKHAKKKSKAQLNKELKKKGSIVSTAPVESMTFEVIKPKRKEREF